VAAATRTDAPVPGFGMCKIPVPADYAVLVPDGMSASLRASWFEMLADVSEWHEEIEFYSDSEDDSTDASTLSKRGHVLPQEARRRRPRSLCKRRAALGELRPLDRELHVAVVAAIRNAADEQMTAHIRGLLCRGANPLARVSQFAARPCALDQVLHARDGLQEDLANLGDAKLCHHRLLGACSAQMSRACSRSATLEKARGQAKNLLAELAALTGYATMLAAAAELWSKATPSKQLYCSRDCLYGRGVVYPNPDELCETLATLPQAACKGNCRALGNSLLSLAQAVRGKRLPVLCCSEGEVEAMRVEDELAQKAEALEDPSHARCCQCQRQQPMSAFSSSQLRNKCRGTRRCKQCVSGHIPAKRLRIF